MVLLNISLTTIVLPRSENTNLRVPKYHCMDDLLFILGGSYALLKLNEQQFHYLVKSKPPVKQEVRQMNQLLNEKRFDSTTHPTNKVT